MSLADGAGGGDRKRNADAAEDSDEAGRKVIVLDKQPEVQGIEAMNNDLTRYLEQAISFAKIYINAKRIVSALGITAQKGLVLHGKPDLGLRVKKFLEQRGKDMVNIWPRNLETLTASRCENTFERAFWFSPSIILLIGLETAAPDVAQVIQEKIKENAVTCAHVLVLATTAMFEHVPGNLKDCFSVVKLQELNDSTNRN